MTAPLPLPHCWCHLYELIGTATGPPASPAHGVGWVNQTGVVADARAVRVSQHGAPPPTASLVTHHHLHRSLYPTAGAHHAISCELIGTATGPPAAQHTAQGGSIERVPWPTPMLCTSPNTVQHLPLPLWPLIIICATPSTPLQAHTTRFRVSRFPQPLVHLLHQHTALGGSIKRVSWLTSVL
jgi:hypothetical protein